MTLSSSSTSTISSSCSSTCALNLTDIITDLYYRMKKNTYGLGIGALLIS